VSFFDAGPGLTLLHRRSRARGPSRRAAATQGA
jgi:hypothetical protein